MRRVAALAATLLFVSVLVFLVVRVLPGDPVDIILGIERSPETAARLRAALGLDRPLIVHTATGSRARLAAISAPRSSTTCRWPVSSRAGCR